MVACIFFYLCAPVLTTQPKLRHRFQLKQILLLLFIAFQSTGCGRGSPTARVTPCLAPQLFPDISQGNEATASLELSPCNIPSYYVEAALQAFFVRAHFLLLIGLQCSREVKETASVTGALQEG